MKARIQSPHSRLTWRVRNSPGCCPDFLSAAKAPGVATIWPSSKAGCLLICCIGKTPFVGLVFLLLRGTAESGALKANALPGGARRLAVRAVKAAWLSRSSKRSGRALTGEAGGPGAGFRQEGPNGMQVDSDKVRGWVGQRF